MATYDDILGNGGGTPFPKGSKEWHEQQQDGSSAPPPVKGTQEPHLNLTQLLHRPLRPSKKARTVVPFHMLNCSRNLILILHRPTKNLLKRRKSRNVTKFLLQLVMAYLLSPICTLQHRVHRICIVEKTQLRKGYRLGMID